MRKFYLLTSFTLCLLTKAISQDTANFIYTIGINNQVIFTNTSHLHGDMPRKAIWSFGDGVKQITTPLSNTFYQYNNAGTYTVCLRIYKYSTSSNDSSITAEACKTFTLPNSNLGDSCSASFSLLSAATNSLTQTFVAQPWHNHQKRPEEICWKFGDGKDTCIKYDPALSNNYAVNHIYYKAGQYNVCIRIRYQGGCVSEYCRVISFGVAECKADFFADSISASPLSKHFTVQPWNSFQKKPLKICWNFGDGITECKQYTTTSTDAYAINHQYAKAGQYNVCVSILYDGGCESKQCTVINVAPPPPPDTCLVNILEAATNINNLERHFYAELMKERRPEMVCWIFGDGKDTCINLPSTSAIQPFAIAHRYLAPGVYRACVKVKYAGGCVAYKCLEVVIRPTSNVCGGYLTDSLLKERTFRFNGFSIQNPNDGVVTWRWSFGDGTSSNDRNVTHTYPAPGKYEVCLYIKTNLGCETKICKYIIIQGEPKPILQLTPNPVSSVLHTVFVSAYPEQVTINVYNANGILLKTFTRAAVQGTNAWEFDVAGLPAGIYSVVVKSPHQLANAVFFKQ
jgi:PKD repeat protein